MFTKPILIRLSEAPLNLVAIHNLITACFGGLPNLFSESFTSTPSNFNGELNLNLSKMQTTILHIYLHHDF